MSKATKKRKRKRLAKSIHRTDDIENDEIEIEREKRRDCKICIDRKK